MKRYAYFPGCSSSEGTALAYGLSTLAVAEVLEMELTELVDWNCCGSTPYTSTDKLESTVIGVRNLALAEKTGLDLVTPCSACYTTLNKANDHFKHYPAVRQKATEALASVGLEYKGGAKVRHLFEVVYHDVGLDFIKSKVLNPLTGLKVAAYYGCQLVRPEPGFDDPENPQSLDRLMNAIGAEPVNFPLKAFCCGGSLVIPELDVALGLIHKIVENAAANGAQCLVTFCPLCQTNLDVYQDMANAKFGTPSPDVSGLPVLFFTQLLGLALGVAPKALALDKSVVSPEKVLAPFTKAANVVR